MNRYFFNFRKGNEMTPDPRGMYLSGLEEARAEALRTCRDLQMMCEMSGDSAEDCQLEVVDASGEPVLVLSCKASADGADSGDA